MYSLEQLRRGISCPALFFREANRLYHRRLNTRTYNAAGVDIFEEDWDNLLVLDACRYNMFAEQVDISGRLERRISRGSSTREFLDGNVRNRTLHDTVYVTANPQFYRHRDWLDASFHAVEHVWMDDGWDETHQTVLPETVTERALAAAERYPHKRLLIHFMQPHYPFISDETLPFDDSQPFTEPDEPASWHHMLTGEIDASPDAIWRAFRANLDRALPAVERLVEKLDGQTVISADHGNMVGERASPFPIREWGHPRGIYTTELVEVPWLVVDGTRREISSEAPVEDDADADDTVVDDRLENLGYV